MRMEMSYPNECLVFHFPLLDTIAQRAMCNLVIWAFVIRMPHSSLFLKLYVRCLRVMRRVREMQSALLGS